MNGLSITLQWHISLIVGWDESAYCRVGLLGGTSLLTVGWDCLWVIVYSYWDLTLIVHSYWDLTLIVYSYWDPRASDLNLTLPQTNEGNIYKSLVQVRRVALSRTLSLIPTPIRSSRIWARWRFVKENTESERCCQYLQPQRYLDGC